MKTVDLDRAMGSRLQDTQRYQAGAIGAESDYSFSVALPVGYEKAKAKAKRKGFPVLILLDAEVGMGSAVEISRLMADTAEVKACIVIGIEKDGVAASRLDVFADTAASLKAFIEQRLLPWCTQQLAIDLRDLLLCGYDAESGTSLLMACRCDSGVLVKCRDVAVRDRQQVPAISLTQGLRSAWSTGNAYGKGVSLLAKPLVNRLAAAIRPLFARLKSPYAPPESLEDGALVWSETLQREFEVFVYLPDTYAAQPHRHFPLLLALDANYCFHTVAESARRLAAQGKMQDVIVLGLGVPRKEGPTAFGLRRLAEFAPPCESYGFDDELGRALGTIFSLSGQDIRRQMGQASGLFDFIQRQLLPSMYDSLRIDRNDLGILGHSAGGTFVAYVLHQDDSPFRGYICSSPGLAISGDWLLKNACPTFANNQVRNVVTGIGSEEFDNGFNIMAGIPETPRYAASLKNNPALNVQFIQFEAETHSSVLPSTVAQGLESLWPAQGVAQVSEVMPTVAATSLNKEWI